jgi:cyclophilin family peptidyl-prolyl cis-trans isomerase
MKTKTYFKYFLLSSIFISTSSIQAKEKKPVSSTPTPAPVPAALPKYKVETSLGNIVIELDSAKAPLTAANFKAYADKHSFDNTIFHRVIPGFMIQGGGMNKDMKEVSTLPPVKNEAKNGLKNLRGTLAMARTSDPHSATIQFFINLKDNSFLDYTPQSDGYAVFGKVVEGMDTVDKVAKVKTSSKGFHDDVPVEPIFIKTVTPVK